MSEAKNPYRGRGIPPENLKIEEEFNKFVECFGGTKVASLLPDAGALPKNADYYFPKQNVLAELKTLEVGDSPFGSWEAFFQTVGDAAVSPNELLAETSQNSRLPKRVADLLEKRLRRAIEQRLKYARKQLMETKKYVGDQNTKSIILLANDRIWFVDHAWIVSQAFRLMADNFNDEHVDGLVYFSPNIVTRFEQGEREYSVWVPAYRVEGDSLAEFVNELGTAWFEYYMGLVGESDVCAVKTSELEVGAELLKGDNFRRD